MSYFRPMGDGPITDPSQVDDSLIVGEVPPTRVQCIELAADSPWRRPGQVCADAPLPTPGPLGPMIDAVRSILDQATGGGATTAPDGAAPPATHDDGPNLWLWGGAGVLAYYLLRKKR